MFNNSIFVLFRDELQKKWRLNRPPPDVEGIAKSPHLPELLGVPRRRPHRRSGPENLPPMGANPWSPPLFYCRFRHQEFCMFCVFLCVFIVDGGLFCVFCVFGFVLSVPVQVIAWKDSSSK